MSNALSLRKRIRKSYQRITEVALIPNLIEVQKNSYEQFLQMGIKPEKRDESGLQAVLKSVFPVEDFSGKAQLEFFTYEFEPPKYTEEESRQRGVTYSAPLRVTFRLVVWDVDETSGARSIRDIKEQDVYMGDMPLMTARGTFIVNGIERVIVSQMHRSPGVFFDHDKGKTHASGKYLFSARVIPYRGSWLDFEFDGKDILNVRIDRKRKFPVSTLLYALLDPKDKKEGLSDRACLLQKFYNATVYERVEKGWKTAFTPEWFKGRKLAYDLYSAKGDLVFEAGKKITARTLKDHQDLQDVLVPTEELHNKFVSQDIVNPETGEILVEAGGEVSEDLLQRLDALNVDKIEALDIDYIHVGPYLRNTIAADKNQNRDEALLDIYRIMRPGEPPTPEGSEELFRALFFDQEKFDLSSVGRVKLNSRLGFETDDQLRVLRSEDIFKIVQTLLDLKDGQGEIDDIDNLSNRRVRSVGELLENQYRVGLVRMERAIKERMSSVDIDAAMPHDLINAKPVVAAMKEFFGSSQLSQFMDQTNPLSEITHKRRLSALGPGGLTRERAGFEVRDVHPTHYGRICPIETPEGPNIGLINSLATYARVNKYGFIESPYRRVKNCHVTEEVTYLTAMEETKYAIAQANADLDDNGNFKESFVSCRRGGDYMMVPSKEIDFIDVSPKQLVSVAASLIPFLENDDANRALMGSNMQRQAVPLLKAEAPLVGTGMESAVAKDSGAVVLARNDGIVDRVEGTRIVIHALNEDGKSTAGVDIYNLKKFVRSNQSTCINQRPLVRKGDIVKSGEIIADGPSTDEGELALGKNVLMAFLSWNGYNYEDSIIISERIVRDDVFTSIHIDEFEVMARDTKLGQEEITRDIPNVSDESLRNLDETGIVSIGAQVKAGDILVGKVTPKGESPVTPEEKLLRAIFGEKASDVRDSSLRLPPGAAGTIVDVRVFNRRGIEKDERSLAIERFEVERLAQDRDDERRIIEKSFSSQVRNLLIDQKVVSGPADIKAGTIINESVLASLRLRQWLKFTVEDEGVVKSLELIKKQLDSALKELEARFEDKVEKVRRGDELLPGVMKMVKVFVATKRKLQPGDKMAGRHGNKGVVSVVVPQEDMPYLDDGTPIDVILNPLGIPSRMNVGQVLEAHLGWAARGLGHNIGRTLAAQKGKDTAKLKDTLKKIYNRKDDHALIENLDDDDTLEVSRKLSKGVPIATPVFDGAHEKDIVDCMKQAGLDTSGQVTLFDGKTGEAFDRKVTVGYKYILKLDHLVDDKLHARSVGPYSLVTQQPLGGKAQFGGQRFGEMEVWALEAYGAAYTLQEMLTVKSDDVAGRTKVYESIIRGDNNFEAGVPESFNVLVKELRSLGLNTEFQKLND